MKLDKRYMNDDTVGMELEDSPWKSIAITSALIAGGVVAYKSGMLKKGMDRMIKSAGSMSGRTSDTVNAVKNWTNNPDLAKKFNNSLVRNSGLISYESMLSKKGAGDLAAFGRRMLDKDARGKILKDTSDDFSYIANQLKDRAKTFDGIKSGLVRDGIEDTRLFRLHNRIKENKIDFERYVSPEAGNSVSMQNTSDMMKKLVLSQEEKAKQMKRSGHRSATIGDFVHIKKDEPGGYILPKENGKVFSEEMMENIRELGNREYTDADGKVKRLIESNDFENLVVDRGLMVDGSGKLSDLRKLKNTFESGVETMATQFQVPVIGINPLRLFGLDNIKNTVDDFAVFAPGTVQSAFTASTDIIKKPFLLSGGNLFDVAEDGSMNLLKSNVSATRVFRDNRYNNRKMESLLKLQGVRKSEIEEFTSTDGFIKNAKGIVGRKLDIGRSDRRNMSHRDLGPGNLLNPNEYLEKMTNWLFKGNKKHNGLLSTTKSMNKVYANNATYHAPELDSTILKKANEMTDDMARLLDSGGIPILIATNNSIKVTDAILNREGATIGKFFGQYVAGRKNLDEVTAATLSSFHIVERINSTLNIAGIGLSVDSLGSSPAVLANLIVKRAMPVVAGYNAFEYMNYLTEDEETGDNVSKKVARGIVNTKLSMFRAKDAIGITGVAKKIKDLTPGSDQITELPGINTLDLDLSEEEMRDYYENGYDPIRKGRYWDLGVQAFTGSKITRHRPNWYRRIEADVKFSDSQFGSREEYFKNAAFPTPSHLFAPVRHFVTDKYHWENKHYEDRPYPVTAPAFNNVPVVGPLLGGTVGRLIKPQRKMHETEMNSNQSISSVNSNTGTGLYATGSENQDLLVTDEILSGSGSSGMIKYGNARPALYTTASGKVSVVGLGNQVSTPEARSLLQEKGIGSVIGATQRLDRNTGVANAETDDYMNAANVTVAAGETYNNLADFLGIYGYMGRTFTGKANQDKIVLENPAYATSMGKMFWDQEVGGLGGEINEIFRRFIPRRGQNDEYYNPIRNTQPDWMPGDNYFIDFKKGDPYVKVTGGEERIAGEGYERLHGIDIYNMRIGSSSLGKTKDEIIGHYLNRDPILEGTISDEATKAGDEIHKRVEREWLKSGYAIEVEGKIEDKANNIIGFYDARVHDETSPDGQAIIDVKTVSDNIFSQVKKSGLRDKDMRQVNYYLWALGLQRGGVFYINRDTGEELDLKFDFNQKAFNDSIKNVYDARAEIMTGIDKGTISRADLYDHVDRMRILGDVAPYSEEYKQMAAIVSRSRLSEEEEAEVKQIRERVSAQKKPLRTYDYKFSTSDIVKEKVEVQRMYDYNTIYLDGYDKPMRFAGLDVRVGDTDEEKEEIAEYMNKLFRRGSNLTVGVDKASNLQTKSGSIRGVVYKNGRNINKELIDLGYAKVNEKDNSAAAVQGRYNGAERMFGSLWEKFAHMDTPYHTKFFKVRSPLENYKRERVYGKEFNEWHDPIQDFVKPLVIDRNVERKLIPGLAWGAIVGSMFGTRKFGKIVGAFAGMGAVTAGKAGKAAYEIKTNTTWKPERVRKENEINEYMDMLKYIKSRKLYNEYADKAMKEDGINVRSFVGSKQSKGRDRKNEKYELQDIKQNVKGRGVFIGSILSVLQGDTTALVNPFGNEKEELRKINARIEEQTSHRELLTSFSRDTKNVNWQDIDRIQALQILQGQISMANPEDNDLAEQITSSELRYIDKKDIKSFNKKNLLGGIEKEIMGLAESSSISQNVVKAVQYYNDSEQTMYGYDKGDPITNLLLAMPKRDRDYFNLFVNAPEEERMEILELAPKYMRRPLMASWGMTPEAKTSLTAYFQQKALPDQDWAGWNENVSLNAVRVKMFKKADIDFSDVNVWGDDIREANASGEIPIPRLDARSNAYQIKNDLYDILGAQGIRDLQIEMKYSNVDSNVSLDLSYDAKLKIEQEMKEYERNLVG